MTPTNSNVNLTITEKTGTTTTEKVNKTIWTGNTSTEFWNMGSTGSFEYTVTLAGHEVCKKTVTVTAIAGSAQTCKFANTTRVYGEKVKFQVEKLKADKDATWELDNPDGTKVAEGTFANRYNMSFWETGDINVKASGTYTLKLNGSSACTADVTVTQPSAENCRLDASTIPTGSTTKFRWDLKNCKENQCSYEIRRAGVLFTSQSNVGEQNDRQYDVNDAGEYVVWLNGAATNCKQTLSIATSGSLTCSVDANILVGAQWQNVKVTSTRATSKYDLWIDNSIGKNTNGDDMSNFEIAENAANAGVGGFTCSPVGSHTYKITPHGNTTSLCNGSFNCVSAPTADCYFKYNNGGQTVTGSVPAETQLQFCVGPNIVDAQTTVKGTKKAGSFSEGLYLNKNQTNCYYFEAPSTKDSYTFSVEYDENEVCNTTPTLVVE